MGRKKLVWISVVLVALVAAARGRGDRGCREGVEGGHAQPGRVLDAAAGADQADRGVPQDAGRGRHQHPGVLRRLLGAGPGGGQRPARRRRDPQHRQRHQRPRRQGPHQQELGQAELQRRRLELRRRVRAPQRQPEEGQGLERPDEVGCRGRDGQPVHRAGSPSGTSSPATSPSGSSARRRSRRSPTCRSSTRTTSSRRTRRGRTRRTRSSRARATSCSRSRARRSTGRSRTSSRARRC